MSKHVTLPPLPPLPPWLLDGYQPRFDRVEYYAVTPPSCDACQLLETAYALLVDAANADWPGKTEEWEATEERWCQEYKRTRR